MKLTAAAFALLTTACTLPAAPLEVVEPRPVYPAPWPAVTVCVLDAPLALSDVIRAALDVWGAYDWQVYPDTAASWMTRNASRETYDCVPIVLVPAEYASAWPEGRVAQTSMRPGTLEPLSIEISEEWWARCPWARWATLLHEVGHAVGHPEHTVAETVMSREVACSPERELLPDARSVERARRRRAGRRP